MSSENMELRRFVLANLKALKLSTERISKDDSALEL
jgi:hypothetical protein